MVNGGMVVPECVHIFWPLAAPLLAGAVERDEEGRALDDILDELLINRAQLWLIEDDGKVIGAVVTAIHTRKADGARLCKLEWAGGERVEEWMPLVPMVEDWARRQGCREVRVAGRPGFARLFGDYRTVEVHKTKVI